MDFIFRDTLFIFSFPKNVNCKMCKIDCKMHKNEKIPEEKIPDDTLKPEKRDEKKAPK